MVYSIAPQRLAEAARQFDEHLRRKDGATVVHGLAYGLMLLRESLFLRVHQDVEHALGHDSMLMPTSEKKTRDRAVEQIETFQAVECAAAAAAYGYVPAQDDWFLRWLLRLRLRNEAADGAGADLVRRYGAGGGDDRRLLFTDVLSRVVPEARHAPLVLFRLFPLAVHVTVALAFGDHGRASELRRQQLALLPAIADCGECRGALLELGEHCPACGNPLWKYRWLTAVD